MEAAKAKLSAAQNALTQAQSAYQAALDSKTSADQAVSSAQSILSGALADQASKQSALNAAQQVFALAQSNYDTLLISDPSWVRPNIDKTISVDVPYVVQVPHTETIATTTQVPRQVTTVVPAGLVAKSYNMYGYNNRPPLPTENRLVSTQTVPNIDFQWGGGMVLNSGLYEDVIVNFSGTIYAPQTGTYSFYSPADDGTKLIIDGSLVIDDWFDKGGGGSVRQINLTEGSHAITLWYYENGGGANVWLYWAIPGTGLMIVPASAFGEQTVVETVYDEVITTQDVTTYTEETLYRREDQVISVPDENASAPLINDPELLALVEAARTALSAAQSSLDSASQATTNAQSNYQSSVDIQAQKASIISVASSDVTIKQQELNVAQQELEAIPPFREPAPSPSETTKPTQEPATPVVEPTPTPEPSETTKPTEPELPVDVATVDPASLTDKEVEQLVVAAEAVLATAEQGSPAYEEALQALAVAAVADDPQLPAALESIPGAAAVLETFNALGNVGADMAPAVRDEAEKTVIASVIATGAAVNAATGAAVSAASAAAATTTTSSSTSSSSGSGASSSGSSGGSGETSASESKTSSRRRETK